MRESAIEKRLARAIDKRNGLYFKLGNCGLPDRLVILPGGRHIYIELKSEDGTPSDLQVYWIRKLKEHGCEAYILIGMADVNRFIEEVLV